MPASSLSKAVGKLVTGKVAGHRLDAATERLIADGIISGVTLFKENACDIEQLGGLLDNVKQLGGHDFLITVDQEGGAVQRFDEVLTPLPSAMALAALGDVQSIKQLISLSARQLAWLQVNCNLAPVLDVNSNPLNPIIGTRSFGSDPQQVVAIAQVVADAYMSNGVVPVGKHFPGHGDTAEDSHLSLAVAHADRRLLAERELLPFARLAHSLPAMLIGHVWLPAYDQERIPASLSATVTGRLLREQLGFDGYLLTDDMPVMKAIVDHYGLEEAALMAVKAGADNLLISGSVAQMEAVHKALLKAAESGELSQERIARSLERRARCLRMTSQAALGSLAERLALIKDSLASGLHLSRKISASACALVRGSLPHLSTGEQQWVLLAPNHPRYRLDLLSPLSERLPPNGALHERRYTLDPPPDEIAYLSTFARGKHCLLLTYRGMLNRGQLNLASSVAAVAKSCLAVACDVPYELSYMPDVPNALATFDPSDLAMAALADVLTGQAKPQGRCPVDMRQVAWS